MAGGKGMIKWQLPMQRVLYALIPLAASAVYFFGWRALIVLAVCNLAAFLSEYVFARVYKEEVTSAAFVTGTLLALSLPPSIPLWMTAMGAVFAIVFGKMVYGGFGRNVFNPALTGRAFLYISFGAYLTGNVWADPVAGWLGGLAAYAPDAVTTATPGVLMKAGKGGEVSVLSLLLGNTAGTLGGTSSLLALLGGVYLCWRKVANYRIPVAGLAALGLSSAALWAAKAPGAADPLRELLASNAIFGLFFFATDPVSAPKTNEARWLYGALVGVLSTLITVFSVWPAGTMFAILLANMFGPITDYSVKAWKERNTVKPA